MDTEKRDEELINSIYETLSSEPSAIRKLDVIIRDTDLKLQPVVERLKELNESDQVDQYEIVRLEKEKERIRKEHLVKTILLVQDVNSQIREKTRRTVSLLNRISNTDKIKLYPNDPCPCGSGKKYKKCCGR